MYLISNGGINSNTVDTTESIMLTKNIDYLDGIKLDVRKTKDNIFVLSKYNDLSKFTYSNRKVNECNYHYLRKVKFPSYIFKYYIPTLEEILIKYNKNKIIVLELYDINFNSLDNLLNKYNYNYYFISRDNKIIDKLHLLNYDSIGKILDNYDDYIINENATNNTFQLNVN